MLTLVQNVLAVLNVPQLLLVQKNDIIKDVDNADETSAAYGIILAQVGQDRVGNVQGVCAIVDLVAI